MIIHGVLYLGELEKGQQAFVVAVEHKVRHALVRVKVDHQEGCLTYRTPAGWTHEQDDVLHFALEHLLLNL